MTNSIPPGSLVLVTGGTGFLGRAVLNVLASSGYRTRAFQRSDASTGSNESMAGDVRDPDAVARALSGAAGVIHTAGLAHVFRNVDMAPFDEINDVGTAVVARAAVAAGLRRMVLVSSVAVYGGTTHGGTEGAPLEPRDPYARSKANAERSAIAEISPSGTSLVVLRMATLYGDGDRGNVQRLIEAIDSGRFVWIGTGANKKSLLHVHDAARGCVVALAQGAHQIEVFNVSDSPVAMRDIVEGVAAALGRGSPRIRIPAVLALAMARAASPLGVRGRAAGRTLSKWLTEDAYPSVRFCERYSFRPLIALNEGLTRQVAAWRKAPLYP